MNDAIGVSPTPYPGADGIVRVYPAGDPSGGGLVWVHGGAFAFGTLDDPEADSVATYLAERGITVVSVDYRLAPVPEAWTALGIAEPRAGAHYPAASDDVLTAWRWTVQNSALLHIDVERLAIGGASAGANLVAGATLRLLEDGNRPLPSLIALIYPTLLAVQPAPDADLRAALDSNPMADTLGPDALLSMYENYLGGPADAPPLPAAPGLARPDEVAGFPRTLIINAEVDVLRVSGEHFARTLSSAGVEVETAIETGTTHGYLNRPDENAASRSLDLIRRRIVELPVAVGAELS